MSHGIVMFFYVVLIVSVFASDKLYISTYLDTNTSENSDTIVFYIISKIGVLECIEDCKSRKRCQFVNYVSRSSTCFLLGTSAGGSIDAATTLTRLTDRPGFLFGIKSEWDLDERGICETCPDLGHCSPMNTTSLCKTAGCIDPSKQNADVYGTQFVPENWVKYLCNPGYISINNNTAECQESGTWNPTYFRCIYDCGTLMIANGKFTATSGTTENTTATLACDVGYILYGNSVVTCTESGWNGSATCSPIDCGAPTFNNGQFTAPSGTTFGMSAALYCDPGFDFTGDTVVNCTVSGWDGSGICTPMDCGAPSINNGQFTATSGTTFGMSATLYCDPGYDFSGDSLINCIAAGWDGSGTCTQIDCGAPIINNGQLTASSGTTFGMSATLYCDPGYDFTGDTVVNCTASGWDGSGTCTPIDCGAPAINNGQFTATSGTTFGMSATLYCDPGYDFSGDSVVNCIASGWDGSGTCTPIDCGAPAINNGQFTATSGTTFGMSATLYCNPGYDFSGDSLVNCIASGWDGSGTCTPIYCGAPTIDNGQFTAPSGTTFGMSATLSCDPLYDLSGDTVVNCIASGWDGNGTCTPISCPDGQQIYGTSCYKVITQHQTWSQSKSNCESLGGQLVDVNTYEEHQFVVTLIQANDDSKSHWTGGNDKGVEGVFRWSDGTLLSSGYTNWEGNNPSDSKGGEDCLDIIPYSPFNYMWNDNVCSYSFPAICEIDLY